MEFFKFQQMMMENVRILNNGDLQDKAIEFIINCDDDVIVPEFGIKDIENY